MAVAKTPRFLLHLDSFINEALFWCCKPNDYIVKEIWKIVFIILQTPKPEFISICSSGNYFGIQDKRKIRIWNVPAKDSERHDIKKIRLHHTKKLTTLAFHPTKRIVAAGDVTGRILIWRGFGSRAFSLSDKRIKEALTSNDDDRPGVRGDDDADSCTTWHWHSAEVKLLLFSSDGAYLYSGMQKFLFTAETCFISFCRCYLCGYCVVLLYVRCRTSVEYIFHSPSLIVCFLWF